MSGGSPTNWKIIIPQKFSNRSESSEPHGGLLSQGLWQWEEKTPENLSLKVSGVWLQELHRTGGNRNSTLGGHTQMLLAPGPRDKKR